MTFAFEDINLLLIVLLMLMLRNLLTTLRQVENLKLKFWRDFEPIYLINFEKKLSRLAPRQFFFSKFCHPRRRFSLSDAFISKSGLVLSIANCEHATVQTSAQTCITIRSAAFFVSRTGKLLETSAVEES